MERLQLLFFSQLQTLSGHCADPLLVLEKVRLPTLIKNGVFGGCHGLKDYKRVWKAEVSRNVDKILADVVPNWQYFKEEAFPLRHKLIHGVGGPPGVDYGRARVMAIIDASEDLVEFTSSKEVNIFQRIKVRRKVRSSLT